MKKVLACIVLLAMSASLLMTGCGSKKEKAMTESKTVTMAMQSGWNSLNPYAATTNYDDCVVSMIFDSLIYLKGDGTVEPRLAEKWEVSDDHKTMTFHLRKDAKWQDGKPVTADDVIYTAKLISNPDLVTQRRYFPINVAGTTDAGVVTSPDSLAIKKIDDNTFSVDLKVPGDGSGLLTDLVSFFILPEHLLKDIPLANFLSDPFWKNPIGSGPLKYDSQIEGDRIEYVPFDEYYGGKCDFSRFVIRVVQQANMLPSLKTGEVDLLAGGSLGAILLKDYDMAKEDKNLVTSSLPTGSYQFMIMDNTAKGLSNPKVRQAINMAIDKQLMVDSLLDGQAQVMNTFYTSNNMYYDSSIDFPKHDEAAAKKLLEEAGWDSKTVVQMGVPTGNSVREQSAVIIQQNLAKIGITVELQSMDMATMLDKVGKHELQFALCGAGSTVSSAVAAQGFLAPDSAINFSHVTVKDYQEGFDKIKAALTKDDRSKIATELQKFANENMPYVYLYTPNMLYSMNKRVTNWDPLDSSSNNWDVWNWKVD